ncbi:hypothetical protein CMK19_00190 [Candidatus Poribacteria bacterium]|nr:hypothetical protein [Candidatus Poribacteria bacterium]
MALTEINSKSIKDGEIVNADIADDTIAEAKLDISNAPSDGKFLQYKDSSDKLTWADVDTTTIPVADEDTDTTSFPVFTTAATGDQAPKTNEDKLKFNAGTGTLQATHISTIASGGTITAWGTASGGGGGITEACSLNSHGINISATNAGACDIRFGGTTVNDYIAFKSDGAFSGTTTFILPDGDGSADQVLKTDGSGNLDWTDAGSGATGGGTEKIFWENGTTIDQDYTVGTSFGAACNAMSAGPITINTGKTVTVDAGDTWTIV